MENRYCRFCDMIITGKVFKTNQEELRAPSHKIKITNPNNEEKTIECPGTNLVTVSMKEIKPS